jgi:hypothetical protein
MEQRQLSVSIIQAINRVRGVAERLMPKAEPPRLTS